MYMYNVGGYEWSRECADAGDALCQYTYGWRVHLHPTLSQEMKDSLRNEWMQKSANGGFAQGMFTVGRSELGTTHEIASLLLFIIICHGSFFFLSFVESYYCCYFSRGVQRLEVRIASTLSSGGGGQRAPRQCTLEAAHCTISFLC